MKTSRSITALNMFRVLALFCLVAAPTFGGSNMGLTRTYSSNLTPDSTHFVTLPKTIAEASEYGWINVTKPDGPRGYEPLVLWCTKDDYMIGVYFDDTNNAAGLQVAINPDKYTGAVYDWEKVGFTNWTVPCNGTTVSFWTIAVYFLSTDDLKKSAASRIAARDDNYLIQGDYIYVTGFNGELMNMTMNESEMEPTIYTLQACMPGMGNHWMYNMSSSLACSVETIATWYSLMSESRGVGVGLLLPGKYWAGDGIDPFENPTRSESATIVPRGPECLYDYSDTTGMSTLHFYFTKDPYNITC